MMTYRRDEIINKHNQRINYFSKQPGNTELEKYLSMVNTIKKTVSHYRFLTDKIKTLDGIQLTFALFGNTVDIFNDSEEKVGELEVRRGISDVQEVIKEYWEDLKDMGFNF